MKTWCYAVLASLVLLAGCGGSLKNSYTQGYPSQTGSLPDSDATLDEEPGSQEGLNGKNGGVAWDPSVEKELKKWERQVNFDVPIHVNKQVRSYLVYFCTKRKDVVKRQLARSTRYLPMIKEVFQEYGLPEDLAYLAMIESGFNPNAQSPAGAVGMWQFIKGTGLRYGLVIEGPIDERRDPAKSTRAAARYLLDLYRQFGSWYLAAASYNCGERRVEKELKKSNHENFWELSANKCLPNETKNYVPQLIAATIIAKNPEKFGFGDVPYQQPGAHIEVASPAVRPTPVRLKSAAIKEPVRLAAGKPEAEALPRSRPAVKQASMLARVEQDSREPAPAVNKKTAQAVQAKSHKTKVCAAPRGKGASKGKATPYVASIFGGGPAPEKAQAKKNKAHVKTAAAGKKAGSEVKGKGKKPPATLLAKKGQTDKGQARAGAKKTHAPGAAGKMAKTRVKSLLVSEAQ